MMLKSCGIIILILMICVLSCNEDQNGSEAQAVIPVPALTSVEDRIELLEQLYWEAETYKNRINYNYTNNELKARIIETQAYILRYIREEQAGEQQ